VLQKPGISRARKEKGPVPGNEVYFEIDGEGGKIGSMRGTVGKSFLIIWLIALLLWIPSCATNPVSGQPELMLLSEKDEIRLGRQTDAEIIRQYGLYEDKKLSAYLNEIGDKMVKLSHRPNLAFHFRLLDSSVVNAFAVPGGYVYITRGILAALNNEAELAGVMGHEIGHVTARHSAEQYTRAQLAQLGLGLGMVFSDTLRGISDFAQLGVGLLFLKFSRNNERQADELGVEYSTKAGYDARQMAEFFKTLERMNPGPGKSGLPSWFATHPSPEDRVMTVRAEARELQEALGVRNLKIGRNEYLRHIDGLVFGEDPRQGYEKDNVFYHPVLRFQFPVPPGWKLVNTASQVRIINKKRNALILFSLATGNTPRDAADTFVEKTRALVLRTAETRINNLPAYYIVSDIRTQNGILRVLSYFIKKGKHIFVFHGVAFPSLFGKYRPTFEVTIRGFKNLSDPKKINVKPRRIRIRKVRLTGTVKETLISLGVPRKELKRIALLNGKTLDEKLQANTLLKVVQK